MTTRWQLRLSTLIVAAALGCAPQRGPAEGAGEGGENTLTSAVFYIWDYGDYQQGRLVLVDQEWTCEQFAAAGYWLNWNQLSDGVRWVQIEAYLGSNAGDWSQSFESYWNFQAEGSWIMQGAHYFMGSHGDGGGGYYYYDGAVGREQLGWIGQEAASAADVMDVRGADDELVRGTITSVAGAWDFRAEHCGIQENFPVPGDGVPDRPTEPPTVAE